MPIYLYYLFSGLLCLWLSWWVPNLPLALFLLWGAVNLLLVSVAYLFRLPRMFRKHPNGTIPFAIKCAFAPFLLGTRIYNGVSRRIDEVPSVQQIDVDLFLGNRVSSSHFDLIKEHNIRAVLDVTAELQAPDWTLSDNKIDYLNIAVLDHTAPTREQTIQAVTWLHSQIRQKHAVFIHCALGRGRSVFILAAYLLSLAEKKDIEETMDRIRNIRKTIHPNKRQKRILQNFLEDGALVHRTNAWIIANPKAGGGKWGERKNEVVNMLSEKMRLTIKTTTPEISAQKLTREALEDDAEIIIACGGDGTVNEVATEVVGTDAKLGIIPLGTANAFIHALYGIESKTNPVESACNYILAGNTRRVDTADCNGNLVLLLAGIGFEQKMIETADREYKDKLGQMAYLKSLWDAIGQNQPIKMTIEIDDEPAQEIVASSLVIANAAPITTLLAQGRGEPNMADGHLDITWIDHSEAVAGNVMSLIELTIAGLSKTATDNSVHHVLAKRIRIVPDPLLKYVIDGEVFDEEPLEIKVQPNSLSVFSPEE